MARLEASRRQYSRLYKSQAVANLSFHFLKDLIFWVSHCRSPSAFKMESSYSNRWCCDSAILFVFWAWARQQIKLSTNDPQKIIRVCKVFAFKTKHTERHTHSHTHSHRSHSYVHVVDCIRSQQFGENGKCCHHLVRWKWF